MASTDEDSNQLIIIHLSDIHFGRNHRFSPRRTASGDRPVDRSFPTLLDKLCEDLEREDPGCPVVVCLTGDIVETGTRAEFVQAEEFIFGLANARIFGKARGLESIFVVPGNHDVQYDHDDVGERFSEWVHFHNKVFGTKADRDNPLDLVAVHDRSATHQSVVVCLNSSTHVQKGLREEERGRLTVGQLEKIARGLEELEQTKLRRSIRIALLHHHPVLIPALVESDRGYDAVHESGLFINLARKFGFHLILHGHKHNPYTFTDDTRSGLQSGNESPLLISAGGSAGSTELPSAKLSTNCYNIITVKWLPGAGQARIRVETRGLSMFNDDGSERLPTRWRWDALREDDRQFMGDDHYPAPSGALDRPYDATIDATEERVRQDKYRETRGNMPVVQIVPSLVPGQSYEALLWLVRHPYEGATEGDSPVEVTWSAGEKFEVVKVARTNDPYFCASLTYWGPMLVQAKIRFSDDSIAYTHVYARMPESYRGSGS